MILNVIPKGSVVAHFKSMLHLMQIFPSQNEKEDVVSIHNIQKFFDPRGIAIIRASQKENSVC
jgi:hypothetical protein